MLGNTYSPEQSSVCLLSFKRGSQSNYFRGEGGKKIKDDKDFSFFVGFFYSYLVFQDKLVPQRKAERLTGNASYLYNSHAQCMIFR